MGTGPSGRPRMQPRPTIQDVAQEAGVSTGTVSRVLNRRPGVRAQTRRTVEAAITRLDYRPDPSARELSFRQPTRIGFNNAARQGRLSPFYMLFLEHLMAGFQAGGFRLEEIPTGEDGLPERPADGMVLFGVHDDDPRIPFLTDRHVPFVLVGHGGDVRWTRADDYDGGLQAGRHLLRLGHKEILHVSGDMSGQGAFDRYRGYRDALLEVGIRPEERLLLDGGFSTLSAYRAVRQAHEKGLRFSAVFAASDEMAVGTIAALEDVGRKVPAEVSVVGFDDLPEVGEGLTTIRQDIGRVARAAVALLKEGLRGEPPRHEIVPVQLVVRGTTARRR